MENTTNNPKQRLWPYLLALAVFAVVVLFLHFNPTFHCGGDNCRYLNVARSLRDGRGFRAIWLPDEPVTHLLSPGYVAIISATMAITDSSRPVMPLKLMSVACFFGFILLIYFVFVRYLRIHRLPALGLTIFMCLNITLNSYANYILTEAPFLFLMALTLISLFEFKRAGSWLRS
jgi:4-amino-4-deoxy-L-arabinose transferase-like glycosyltransferase